MKPKRMELALYISMYAREPRMAACLDIHIELYVVEPPICIRVCVENCVHCALNIIDNEIDFVENATFSIFSWDFDNVSRCHHSPIKSGMFLFSLIKR